MADVNTQIDLAQQYAGDIKEQADEALARTFFSRVRVLQYGGAALGQSTCDRIQAVVLAYETGLVTPGAPDAPRPLA